MSYLSYNYLANLGSELTQNKKLFEAKAASARESVFLSHSSADNKIVPQAAYFLGKMGVEVYTDDNDKRLPKPPSPETATILKSEIKQSSRFIVLVSPNSRHSRWIPWELGLADGYKDVAPIAILPITQDGAEEEWTKEEYFGLYPRIYFQEEWRVWDPRDQRYWKLETWLTKKVQ